MIDYANGEIPERSFPGLILAPEPEFVNIKLIGDLALSLSI